MEQVFDNQNIRRYNLCKYIIVVYEYCASHAMIIERNHKVGLSSRAEYFTMILLENYPTSIDLLRLFAGITTLIYT